MFINADKLRVLRAAERAGKIYLVPGALQRSDRQVQRRFRNNDEVREELFQQLSVFPVALLHLFAESSRGHWLVTEAGAEYDPNSGIAICGLPYLLTAEGVCQEEFTHLLDHLLGSAGLGARLSEGVGVTPRLAEVGGQIQTMFRSPQFVSEYARLNEREYLVQGVRFYVTDPDLLAERDPALHTFVAECFLNNDFWEEVLLP